MANLQHNRYFCGLLISIFTSAYILSDKTIVNFLGIVFILFLMIQFGSKTYTGVYTTWIGPYLGHNINPRSLGRWAIVSGATDGLGLEYSRQLAANRMNIVLVSRSPEKLARVAAELEDEFKIETKTIVVDFSRSPTEYFEFLRDELGKLENIGILVNNVGICYDKPIPFDSTEVSLNFMQTLININIFAALTLTKIVLPFMMERNKGAIINIGSITSEIGLPFFSLYSSTKSFIQQFTADLSKEYFNTKIIFQYQYPSYITSKMSNFKKPTLFVPSPKSYVQYALKSLGLQTSSPIWPWHRIVIPLIHGYKFLMPGFTDDVTQFYAKCFWIGYLKRKIKRDKKQAYSNKQGDRESCQCSQSVTI